MLAEYMFPTLPLMSSSGQVVAAALGAAQHRRERIEKLSQTTPGSSRSGASKRKTNPRQEVHGEGSVSTTASTSVPSEKVTPDPKHVRTGAPEPKVLFGSPDDHTAGGCDKTEGAELRRGLSSLSTVPATEEELRAAQVQYALSILAANPVLSANPECLGSFVKALVQPDMQQVPTPMQVESRDLTGKTPENLTQPAPAQPAGSGDSETALAARKAFWAKYKRPAETGGDEGREQDALLTQPTLILGDESSQDQPSDEKTPPPASATVHDLVVATAAVEPEKTPQVPAVEPTVTPPVPAVEPAVTPQVPAVEPAVTPQVPAVEPMVTPQVKAAVEVVETPNENQPEENPIRIRFSKMDNLELLRAIDKVKEDTRFETFLQERKLARGEFGADMVEDLTSFIEWISGPKKAADGCAPAPELASPGHVPPAHPPATTEPPTPAQAPSTSEPATPAPKEQPSTPPPPRQAGDSSVAAALKRLTTVDLQGGCRPPQTLAQLGNAVVPDLTVVIMTLNGIEQPVSLPLTPQQCIDAGLRLANPPHEKDEKVNPTDGSTAEDVDEVPLEDDSRHDKALE
eukprot:s2109_g5.t1